MTNLPDKVLTAKVKLDITDAERKLKTLQKSIQRVNQADLQAEKLQQAILKTQYQQERVRNQQLRNQRLENQEIDRRLRKEQQLVAQADKQINREMQAFHKQQVAKGKAFMREQQNYEKALLKAEQLKQKELEREKIRQRSLRTIGEGDKAAQRMAQYQEQINRANYESWWTAQLTRQEWNSQHRVLSRIRNAWEQIDGRIRKVIGSNTRLNSAYNSITSKLTNVISKTQLWQRLNSKMSSPFKGLNSILNGTVSRLANIATAVFGIMGARNLINVSDTITKAENKLNYTNSQALGDAGYNADGTYSNATFQATQESLDKMYVSAQKVRMSYTDMISNVSKTMALAGDAFQGNIDNAIRFQEVMAEAYAVGGASAQEQSNSMYQLTQALGSGILAGDELRSVREGAPLAYQAIEEFAQGVYNSTDSLKDMASQGKITSDIVVAAMLNEKGAASELDKAFAQTAVTFEQFWTQIKNAATFAFQPVVKVLNNALRDAMNNGIIQKAESLMTTLSKMVMIVVKLIGNAINWIVDNWSWLENVLKAGLVTLGILIAGTCAIATANFIMTHLPLIIIASLIFAIVYAMIAWKNGAIDTCQAVIILALTVAAAFILIGIVIGSTTMLIIGLVIALLAIIFMFFEEVCGGANVVFQFLVNLVTAIVASIFIGLAMIGVAVSNLVLDIVNIAIGLWNALKAIGTNIGIAMSNPWEAAKGAFWDFIADCLEGVKKLEKPINAIAKVFGLEGFSISDVAGDARARANSYKSNLGYVDVSTAFLNGASTYQRTSYSDVASKIWDEFGNPFEQGWASEAYSSGYDWGAGVKDKINNYGAGLSTKLSEKLDGGFKLDKMASELGVDFSGYKNGSMYPDPNNPANQAGGGYNPDYGSLGKNVGNAADSLGNIEDSMDLSQEDLEYLRDLANVEWKKEYTVASINVDMKNANTINGIDDVDSFYTKLTDRMYEELVSLADGVYA